MSNQKKDKDKKKKDKSILEDEIFRIMRQSMKEALDLAVDDLLKDFNKGSN